MANADAAFGLRPVSYNEDDLVDCAILSTDSNVHYIGTPVQLQTSGSNSTAIGDYKAGTLPVVSVAGTTGNVYGVIVGFNLTDDVSESISYNPASTARVAKVVPASADVDFFINCNGTLTATMVGNNANVSTPGGGSTTTGLSSAELDISTVATTATLQLRIKGLANIQDNTIGEAGAVARVGINATNNAVNAAGI